jgi:ABC-2 type transport system permease protein
VTAPRHPGRPDWLVIARREFLERVRTGWFLAVTLLGPLVMVGLIVVPAVLTARSGSDGVRVAIVDDPEPGLVAETLQLALAGYGWATEVAPPDTTEAALLARIRDDSLDGFVTLPPGIGEATGAPVLVGYQGDNATSQLVGVLLQRAAQQAVLTARLASRGLTAEETAQLIAPVEVLPRHTTGAAAGASGTAMFAVGYVVMFVLYMAIVLYAVNVMRSVVVEKTNRVVELMVAAAKPRALMLGKILGVGAVGLVQVAAWAAMGVATLRYRGALLGLFGVEAGGWNVPPIGGDAVAVILAYFLLGYFFYAALYAAIGAMVSTDQEAQQAQTPVVFLLIVPMMCVQLVAGDPRGDAAQLLTALPFSSPILMPMRYLLDGASAAEVALSLAVLAASTAAVAWLAGRIYRVGILMYGKRPSLRELARWVRHG